MLVIISCGKAKDKRPQPAAQLYTSAYFKVMLKFALCMTTPENIRILSAKYGLLKLNQVVEPYELRVGEPNTITLNTVKDQARDQGLLNEQVYAVCGSDYARIILSVWSNAIWVLKDKGTIDKQQKWMYQQMRKATNV